MTDLLQSFIALKSWQLPTKQEIEIYGQERLESQICFLKLLIRDIILELKEKEKK